MTRSRSSFDDLSVAIATATSLSSHEGEPAAGPYRGVQLVSFTVPDAPPSVRAPKRPTINVIEARAPLQTEPAGEPPPSVVDPPSLEVPSAVTPSDDEGARRPPKLPDLSGVVSPMVRCERIIAWISEATGATDVFLADGAGLPIAGATADAEARLAGAGLVASSVAQLAAALPGTVSPLFELHLGEGPFFQIIGFEVAGSTYLIGLSRATPLTYRQAHAIRLACRHALGELRLSRGEGGGSA